MHTAIASFFSRYCSHDVYHWRHRSLIYFTARTRECRSIGQGIRCVSYHIAEHLESRLLTISQSLYKHALDVAALLWRTEVVTTTPLIREQLALMYGDLLTLTSVVATRYYKVVQGTASTTMTLDIYDVCHDVIQSFRDRQETVIDLIWAHQAQLEGLDLTTGLSTKSLRRWLLSMDTVQTTLTQDHTIYLVGQAESTCLWFQKPLGAFVQGHSKVMAVTGHSGSGKSVLAASTVERLQRPLGRKTFSTLYYAIRKSSRSLPG